MSPNTEALVRHAINTGALLGALLAFAFMGQETLSHVALGGLLTYVVPVAIPAVPRPVLTAAALALTVVSLSGCAGVNPAVVGAGVEAGIEFTCWGAHKICENTPNSPLHDDACHFIDRACSPFTSGN